MLAVAVAEDAGPRPLLNYLLLHHCADASTLAATLGRSSDRVNRSLSRLSRRGIVALRDGQYELVSNRRTAVADYAEGAVSLRELARAQR